MKKLLMRGTLLSLCLALAGPLLAHEEYEGDEDPIPSKGVVEGPVGSGNKSYRERVNLITREPLRKEVPEHAERKEGEDGRTIRVHRRVVARQVVKPDKPARTRWSHVKEIARGPVRAPRSEAE